MRGATKLPGFEELSSKQYALSIKQRTAIATVAAKNVLIAPTIATNIRANSLNSNIGELLNNK